MATQVKLPRLGQGMDEGKILTWLKAEGDTVAKGEEIYEVETEKVNVEVESPAKGTLLKIVVPEGGEVPIGTVIAWIGEKGEAIPEDGGAPAGGANGATKAVPAANGSAAKAESPAPAAKTEASPLPKQPAVAVATSAAPAVEAGRVKASPLARRMASDHGIELGSVTGSGPDGRIIARDLEGVEAGAAAQSQGAASGAASTAESGERVPLTSMRKTIARRLTEAWQAPAFFLSVDIDMTAANALRERLVSAMAKDDVKPTMSDVITKACAVALRRNPDVNVHFAGDAIVRFAPAHVGMAVATDNGLVVPVIRDAHAKTIREIAADRKRLVDRARSGKLSPTDMEDGTFSISNLGMMGIDEFTAVLNPPQAAILAIGQTKDTPVVVDRAVVVRPIMKVTATFDHRAVDGAVGARFLTAVQSNLEDPLSML